MRNIPCHKCGSGIAVNDVALVDENDVLIPREVWYCIMCGSYTVQSDTGEFIRWTVIPHDPGPLSRAKYDPTEHDRHVRAWYISGLSQRKYAQQIDIPEATLRRWVRAARALGVLDEIYSSPGSLFS